VLVLIIAFMILSLVPPSVGGQVPEGGVGEGDHLRRTASVTEGILRGQVVSVPDGLPVAEALVTITAIGPGAGEQARPGISRAEIGADSQGRFSATLPAGRYRLTVEAFGFQEGARSDVEVRDGEVTEITVALESEPFRLDEIVVMPSTYGMLRDHVVSGQLVTREELETQPHFGNDIFRAVERVPGITTHDYTAMPYVRGAGPEETLTILDGLELYQPYHLQQWDGSLSIVDLENVRDVDLTTGGFTTEYGDASAGVFTMRSASPASQGTRTTVGLDFLSSMLRSEGTFADGRGGWMASARKGFLDVVFEITGRNDEEDLHPSYYDLFTKVEYEVRPGHLVSAHLLHAGDDNHGIEEDSTVYRHRYGSSYGWATWDARFTQALSAQTVLSLGRVTRDRSGADYWEPNRPPAVEVQDEATFDFFGVRQDWKLRMSNQVMVKWGIDAKQGTADYDYFRWRKYWVPNSTDPNAPEWALQFDTLSVRTGRSGNEVGAYLAGRVQPAERLTLEAGLRYDRQSHTDEQQWGPRVNGALQLTPRTVFRGAWGLYPQSHGLHLLWVADGDTNFYPAQTAEHRVLGVEHILESGITVRAEAYQRLLTDPLPEYRNLEDHVEGLREEGPDDRVFLQPERGRAHGLEVFAKNHERSWFGWSASYAISMTEERVDGEWVPLPFDQRHAINLQFALRPSSDWSVSAAWVYHSGWPYTDQRFGVGRTIADNVYLYRQFGPLNQERLKAYSRVDFRASKTFRLNRGALLLYVDVFNLFNRVNAQAADFGAWYYEGRLTTDQTIHAQLEIMPSLGMRWTF
jgi:hypothetical protein